MNEYQIRLKCQILADQICRRMGLPFIKVMVEQSSEQYKGEYCYLSGFIKIYQWVKGKKITWESIRETFYHEVAHHYQYIQNNNLKHNQKFYDTIVLLKLCTKFP